MTSRLPQLLGLTRRLVFLDAETTGVDPQVDRIVQLGVLAIDPDGACRPWRTLVDPGRPIPPETTAVHGITDERVRLCNQCGFEASRHPVSNEGMIVPGGWGIDGPCMEFRKVPTFGALAARLAAALTGCDLAGKNVRFDLAIASAEFRRAGVAWSYAGAAVICAERLEQIGEPRDLSSLYRRRVGREPIGAHDALADVRMSAELLEAQLEAWPALAEGGAAALHGRLWPGWLDAEGKFVMGPDGVPRLGRWGKKHPGKPMERVTREDPGFWDWMIRSEFAPDAKVIAAEAKMGRYPKP